MYLYKTMSCRYWKKKKKKSVSENSEKKEIKKKKKEKKKSYLPFFCFQTEINIAHDLEDTVPSTSIVKCIFTVLYLINLTTVVANSISCGSPPFASFWGPVKFDRHSPVTFCTQGERDYSSSVYLYSSPQNALLSLGQSQIPWTLS